MTEATVIWTALPAGIRREPSGGAWRARVSVFVAPRVEVVEGAATLASCAAFVDWPATLEQATFQLVLGSESGFVAEVAAEPVAFETAADSASWRALFRPELPVRPFDAPAGDTVGGAGDPAVLDHDPAAVAGAVRAAHVASLLRLENGESPTPIAETRGFTLGEIEGPLASVEELKRTWEETDSELERFFLLQRPVGAGGDQRTEEDDPGLDFHGALSVVGSHPLLLRRLGLVLDFEVDAAALGFDAGDPPARPRLRVVPTLAHPELGHLGPWTAVEVEEAGARPGNLRAFTVADRDGVARRGLEPLGGEELGAVQEHLAHAAYSLRQHEAAVATEDDEEDAGRPLPDLVGGPIRLIDRRIADRTRSSIGRRRELETMLRFAVAGSADAAPPGEEEHLLFAEDVTRGLRIDVRREGGPWRSLCRRAVRYSAGDWLWPEDGPVEDEGPVTESVREDKNDERTVLTTTNTLFSWDGWSLVVPRPDTPADEDLDPAFPLCADLEVPKGSLEPQRFGERYRFLARRVDLAGNSVSLEDAAESADEPGVATPPVVCRRVESAKPPVLVRATAPTDGESGDLVVVRDAEELGARRATSEHHLLPPQVALDVADRHGMFDAMETGESWRRIEAHLGSPPEGFDPDWLREMRTADKKGIRAPYLPDPLVGRAVLSVEGLDPVELSAFTPERRAKELARSCRLIVERGQGDEVSVTTSDNQRSVTIRIPPGRVETVRVAARLGAEELGDFALPSWRRDPAARFPGASDGVADERVPDSALLARAAEGRLTPLAPARLLTLIHAVQRPLEPPAFGQPAIAERSADATDAELVDPGLSFHGATTGRIEVDAEWEDPVDDPARPVWTTDAHHALAAAFDATEQDQAPLAADARSTGAGRGAQRRQDFGDTRHHEVRYTAFAITRFLDFYPPELAGSRDNVSTVSDPVTLHVPATAPPAPPDVAYVLPAFRDEIGEESALPSKAPRVVRQRSTGALRVFMNRGWFSSGSGELLAVVVRGSATPDQERPRLSLWGTDPIHATQPLPTGGPGLAELRGFVDTEEGFAVPGPALDAEEDVAADLALYEVRLHRERDLLYADLEIDPGATFRPFVRLALARYQPWAIERCALSRVVTVSFVQLSPTRSLSVRDAGSRIEIAVSGTGAEGVPHDEEAPPMASAFEAHVEFIDSKRPDTVLVEPGPAATDPALWRPIADERQGRVEPLALTPKRDEPGLYTWEGALEIPRLYLGPQWRLRLVVRELERPGRRTVSVFTVPLAGKA